MTHKIDTDDIGVIADGIATQYYRKGHPTSRNPDGTLNIDSVEPTPPAATGGIRPVHGYQNACRYAAAVPGMAALYKKHKSNFSPQLQKEIDTLTEEDIKILQVVALMRATGRSSADPRNPDDSSTSEGQPGHQNPDYDSGKFYAPQGMRECIKKLKELGVPEPKCTDFARSIVDSEKANVSKFNLYSCILKDINAIETLRDRKKKQVPIDWCPFYKLNEGTTDVAKNDFKDFVRNQVAVIKAQQGFVASQMTEGTGTAKTIITDGQDNLPSGVQPLQIKTEALSYNDIVKPILNYVTTQLATWLPKATPTIPPAKSPIPPPTPKTTPIEFKYVLNAHGGKTSTPIQLAANHIVVTPAPTDIAFTTSVDPNSALETAVHKDELLDVTSPPGQWTAHTTSSTIVSRARG